MELGNFLASLAVIFSPILHNDPTGHLDHSRPTRHGDVPFTVLVEGNVGSGKSTLLKVFEGRSDVKVVPEPVDRWQSVNGTDLLMKVGFRDLLAYAMKS